MHTYIKQVKTVDIDKEIKCLFVAKVERLTRAEIEGAERDDSLDSLFDMQCKEQKCIDTLERLFDFINECYQNDIDFEVLEWLEEFIEEEGEKRKAGSEATQ